MHVIDAASVIDAWGRLVRFHHSQDMSSQLLLKEKVVSFKYTPTDMSPHVMEPERLVLENNGRTVRQAKTMCVQPCYEAFRRFTRVWFKLFE